MKGSALLETMAQGVASQCDKLLSDARAEADAIVADAEAKVRTQREQALAAAESEKQLLDERWRLKAEAEAMKAELAMKKSAVNAVLAEVERIIGDTVNSPEFPGILDALLAELMTAASGDCVVLAPEAHVDHVRQWLSANGHGDLPVEVSAAVRDGVALQDHARTYRVSNTLSGRYARVEQETRRVCMTGLFG